MDLLRMKLRKQTVIQEIVRLAKPYIDKESGMFDSKAFFKTNPYYRNKIPYYFGTTAEFYEYLGVKRKSKFDVNLSKADANTKSNTLRNFLAIDHIKQLRVSGMTLQQIGDKYGVSKQNVEQLIERLALDTDEE
jgi:hypothetical protein